MGGKRSIQARRKHRQDIEKRTQHNQTENRDMKTRVHTFLDNLTENDTELLFLTLNLKQADHYYTRVYRKLDRVAQSFCNNMEHTLKELGYTTNNVLDNELENELRELNDTQSKPNMRRSLFEEMKKIYPSMTRADFDKALSQFPGMEQLQNVPEMRQMFDEMF